MGVLPKPVPETPLLRHGRNFPVRRRHTPAHSSHPILAAIAGCGFRRAPTPPHGKRAAGDHNQHAPADGGPTPNRKPASRRRNRTGLLPPRRRRSRPRRLGRFLLGRDLHPVVKKVKALNNDFVSPNLPQTRPGHLPRHTHHNPRLKPTQVRVIAIVCTVILEMVLPIPLGQSRFTNERLVRCHPARQMPAGRSHILHLGIVNKPHLRQKYSLNSFTCLFDFSHGVPRIFKSEVKLCFTVCLKLNRPVDLAPGKDKQDKGQ